MLRLRCRTSAAVISRARGTGPCHIRNSSLRDQAAGILYLARCSTHVIHIIMHSSAVAVATTVKGTSASTHPRPLRHGHLHPSALVHHSLLTSHYSLHQPRIGSRPERTTTSCPPALTGVLRSHVSRSSYPFLLRQPSSSSMGNDVSKVARAAVKPFTAPVELVVNVASGENVVQSVAHAATLIATAPVQVSAGIASIITAPLPPLHNAVQATSSAATTILATPVNMAAQATNAIVGMVENVAKGENVGHALGKGVSTFTLGVGAEAVRLGRVLVDEASSILNGKESQRRRCQTLHWGARVIVYDDSKSDSLAVPDSLWQYGTTLLALDRATHILPVSTWDQLFRELDRIASEQNISEVQFWGHGSAGTAYIGGDALDIAYMQGSTAFQSFTARSPFMNNGTGLIWFRTCSTLAGDKGQRFARTLSAYFQHQSVRIAGHTSLISDPHPWKHPNLVVFNPLTRDGIMEARSWPPT